MKTIFIEEETKWFSGKNVGYNNTSISLCKIVSVPGFLIVVHTCEIGTSTKISHINNKAKDIGALMCACLFLCYLNFLSFWHP